MFQCFLISWGSNKQKFTSSIVVKESYQLFPVKNCKHHESPSITIHDIRARMTTCSTQPTTLALPSPGFKLPCPLQQGKMSLSTAILSMWEDENNDKIPVYHLHLVIDDDYPASIKLEIKVFFITFTFWGEVRTLKNLSCNLQLWWVMRHLEALSCSTCFLVGSQTETSHTFLWPRVFCLVKSGRGGAPGSKLVKSEWNHGMSWKSWKYHENNHGQIMKFAIKDYGSRF